MSKNVQYLPPFPIILRHLTSSIVSQSSVCVSVDITQLLHCAAVSDHSGLYAGYLFVFSTVVRKTQKMKQTHSLDICREELYQRMDMRCIIPSFKIIIIVIKLL